MRNPGLDKFEEVLFYVLVVLVVVVEVAPLLPADQVLFDLHAARHFGLFFCRLLRVCSRIPTAYLGSVSEVFDEFGVFVFFRVLQLFDNQVVSSDNLTFIFQLDKNVLFIKYTK